MHLMPGRLVLPVAGVSLLELLNRICPIRCRSGSTFQKPFPLNHLFLDAFGYPRNDTPEQIAYHFPNTV